MSDVKVDMKPSTEYQGYSRRAAAAAAIAKHRQRLQVSVHVDMTVLEADWRALEASSAVSLHQGFDWCRAWAACHQNQVVLLHGTFADKTLFILPLEIVNGRMFRTARFIGSPHSNLNTGLFAASIGIASAEQLAATVLSEITTKLGRIADIVTLEKLPFHWRGIEHPLSSLPAVRNQNASYQLPLLGSFEATLAQINAKRRRKKFRVSEKRLEALGGYSHVIARTREEQRSLLDLFFQQKAVRFKALGLPNVFADRETKAFLHRLAAIGETETGWPLQLHAIRVPGGQEGQIIAIAGLSRKGDHVICQFGSIDESIAADSSPGELLFYLMIRDACETGASLFDFGIGDQPYKRSWCTVETVLSDIVLPLTLKGRAAAAVHRGTVNLKSAIKKNPKVYSLIQRLRSRQPESVPPAED